MQISSGSNGTELAAVRKRADSESIDVLLGSSECLLSQIHSKINTDIGFNIG